MATETLLTSLRVAILGLGLMGGSLALALHGKCTALWGIDLDPQIVSLAQAQGVVERASSRPEDLLPQADLVILAAPVRAILDLLRQLPELHPGPAIVMDLGSTKAQIMAAMQELPERFDPVGGHPMCGKERGSLAHAEAGLYRDAPFALVALERTSRRAEALAETLALEVGARPLWLDAQVHDRWAGATSHLPYLTANALAAITPFDAAPLVGPGLQSTTRLAATPRRMMLEILATNRENVLAGLQRLQVRLAGLEARLQAEDWLGLEEMLEDGAVRYEMLREHLTR
ncbi:MAG: prephenate dehydrogenase/arogenate dehydrogenase family protein [Chloroflexota bacterium]